MAYSDGATATGPRRTQDMEASRCVFQYKYARGHTNSMNEGIVTRQDCDFEDCIYHGNSRSEQSRGTPGHLFAGDASGLV